ncbi:MAG: acyltransferase [Candidatus Melainabacteria bacterium]|nr:acyltransferase [Candidatus Melainabacteria bacterium]
MSTEAPPIQNLRSSEALPSEELLSSQGALASKSANSSLELLASEDGSWNDSRASTATLPSREALPVSSPVAKNTSNLEAARFRFIDGLRGICVLMVVSHHIFFEIFESKKWVEVNPTVQSITSWLWHGYLGLPIFIVLSGFCLMLPVVASNSDTLSGGFKGFIYRRAKRILPPYYAALGLSLLLLLVVPGFSQPSGFHWDWSLPAFKKGIIFSHLFLVHNIDPSWITKINHPLWSIAVEWQIYFVFALALMPIRKKLGVIAAFAAACLLAAVPAVVFNTGQWTRPWYLVLFAMGMLGATVSCSRHPFATAVREKLPWGWICSALVASAIYFCVAGFTQTSSEWITAVAITCVMIWAATFERTRSSKFGATAMTFLTMPTIANIGVFSYSIYLIHAPIIALLRMYLQSLKIDQTTSYLLLHVLGIALSLAFGYALFYFVERHFLSKRK